MVRDLNRNESNMDIGINWENLRRQQAPIIPEHKGETDTTNFVRLAGKITDKEREDFFAFMPTKGTNVTSNMVRIFSFKRGIG